jgi:hypothetical protein
VLLKHTDSVMFCSEALCAAACRGTARKEACAAFNHLLTECTLMPGVFMGVAGQDTAFGLEAPDWDSAQAEACEEQWKRMTYPAGHIIHLLPARLLQGG